MCEHVFANPVMHMQWPQTTSPVDLITTQGCNGVEETAQLWLTFPKQSAKVFFILALLVLPASYKIPAALQ